MNPKEFAEELGLEYEGTEMIKGVEFAKYTDSSDEVRYHLIYPEGHINTMSLSEVYADGNYTKGRTRQGNMEVMIDDDGIHEHWEE